jgi:CHAT domain-containing protein
VLFKYLNINQTGRLMTTGTSLLIIVLGTLFTKTGFADTNYESFREWCENKSRISTEAKHTVDMLMQQAKTNDCQQAEQYLLEQTNLDLMMLQLQDLSPLSSLTHLTALNLAGNQITDLQPLTKLTQLSFLLLTDNQISDITPLSQLTNLSYVMIDKNQIQTLPPMPNLKQMTALGLMENPIAQKICPVEPATVCLFSNDGQDQFAIAEEQYQTGDFKTALASFEEVLKVYQESGDRLKQADTLNRIGDIYTILGQYARAIQVYQDILQIRQELGDLPGVGISLTSQANIYQQLGQYQEASQFLEQALENIKQQEQGGIPLEGGVWELPKDEGMLRSRLAQLQNQLGEHEAALLSAQQALERFKLLPEGYNGKLQGQRIALEMIGMTHNQMGNQGLALQSLNEALTLAQTINDQAGMGSSLKAMGDVYRHLEETEKAIAAYQKALDVRRQIGDKVGEGMTLNNMGYTQLKTGQVQAATTSFLAAIEIWESLRPGLTDENKVSLFETQAATYSYLQQALIAQQQEEEALSIAERGRARAFVELLASRLGGNQSEEFQSPQPPTVDEIRRIAQQQNATLVEYSIVEDQLYIWVIQPDGTINLRTVNLDELDLSLPDAAARSLAAASQGDTRGATQNQGLNALVEGTRDEVENPQTTTEAEEITPKRYRNRRLWKTYQLLIEPIEDLLPNNPTDRVVIIPQGSLFSVPFAALQDEEGNYLIEKHTIVKAPAIQVLDLAHQQRQRLTQQNQQTTLVVGNPVMPSIPPKVDKPAAQLDPLPGAETEAKAISQLLQTEPLVGSQATETAVVQQMKSAKIIHLATHGLLQELKHLGLGVPGAMALAPSAEDDGLLTSEEILNLNLNAELVVLSACKTGKGDITGDGVVGLSRSFISAGTPSILASLWDVNDHSTAMLMQEFYRQLQQNPDKAAALRQAMLVTMEEYPKPEFWAAFMLIGEAQ